MSGSNEPFPWMFIMQFGLGTLKLSPSEFWNLSLHELNAALMAHYPESTQPTSRDWLMNAMIEFPDQPKR